LGNTGWARVWLDGELILDNDVGIKQSSGIDWETMVAKASLKLEKGQAYAFKAEYVSGEHNPFALIDFSYKPALGVEGDLLERAVSWLRTVMLPLLWRDCQIPMRARDMTGLICPCPAARRR
jgi:hypothetical protein